MSQTAYTQDPAVAIEGMLADLGPTDVRTAIADEAIAFGLGVTRAAGGAADDRPPRAALPAAAGDVTSGLFLGIARADTTIEQAATPIGYAVDQEFAYLRSGHIWVNAVTVVALGDALFIRHTTSDFGSSRNDNAAGDADQVPGASFRSATAAINSLALVELKGQI
jgi:hypothetical protein